VLRTIVPVKKLALLGTGKTDYPAVKAMVESSGTAGRELSISRKTLSGMASQVVNRWNGLPGLTVCHVIV
jgi:hypothetical protein